MKKSTQKICIILISVMLVAYLQTKKLKSDQETSEKISNQEEKIPTLKSSNNEWKEDLIARIHRIKTICGELCETNTLQKFYHKSIRFEGSNVPTFSTDVDCDAIISSRDIDAVDLSFPDTIPDEIIKYFTLDGVIPVIKFHRFFKDVGYLGNETYQSVWSEEYITEQIRLVEDGLLKGTYGNKEIIREIKELLNKINVDGKSILVIGSENPWIEALTLAAGASKVTTLEYGKIKSEHPQIETLTPEEFRKKYKEGNLDKFDGVISFSSLEHSGLGRYGDSLNPWGDILAVARAWCVTKDSGFMILGLPTGEDKVLYNAHRIYGKYRWPLVTTNWHLLNENKANDNYLKSTIGHGINYFKKINPSEKFLRTSYKAFSRRPNDIY